MSTASGIPGGGPDKGEVHAETPQPIDLAHGHGHHTIAHPIHHTTHVLRASSAGATSVVQIRPVRTILAAPGTTFVGGKGAAMTLPTVVTATHPSILVNRGGAPLTLVNRPVGSQLTGVTSQNLSTLQLARSTLLSNVRPSVTPGGHPTNIAVTPISATSFGTSIRISSPVNNGSWIQTSTQGLPATSFTTVRPTTIQVSTRPMRPEGGKIIHIPQSGGVQHLTHLQVVDGKGSIIKPTTPISVRGTLQQSGSGFTIAPVSPFTIRTPPRTPPSVITTASQAQKVITQPAHGPPIIVNQTQKFTQIQNFSSLQRLAPVISLASNGGNTVITGSSPSLVGVTPRPSSNNIIVNSSIATPASLSKVYPISSREINTNLVEAYINQGHVQPQQNHISSPTLTVVSMPPATYSATTPTTMRPTFVLTSTSNSLKGLSPSTHQILQVQAPATTGASIALPNYYIEPKNLPTNVSIISTGAKRIAVAESGSCGDKKHDKTLVTSTGQGQMILTTANATGPPTAVADSGGGGLVAHFAHPIPLQTTTSSNIQITSHPLSVPKGTPLTSIPHSQIAIHPHSIPTNLVTPAIIATSVTTTTTSATGVITTTNNVVTLSGGTGNGGSAISTITTTTTVSPPSSAGACSAATTSTSAQSPSQSKATLSPRPSILRKREAGACETNFVPLRAQRNLAVNFTASSTPPSGQGNNGPTTTAPPTVLISTVSSKESISSTTNLTGGYLNSLSNFGLSVVPPLNSSGGSGVSILRKEFQPPNEESSWQSSSSNSSSGSTTISATSETAELPDTAFVPYQPPTSLPIISIEQPPITNVSRLITPRLSQSSLPLNSNPLQNGVLVRSRSPAPGHFSGLPSSVAIVAGTHPTPVRHRASLAKGREAKNRSKEVVSPRKKPRKQQLTSSDFIDSSSQEISFYQSKRFKRGTEAGVGKSDKVPDSSSAVVPSSSTTIPPASCSVVPHPLSEPEEERIRYFLQKPRTSIYDCSKYVPNPRHNHFKRYSDVKPKDERRPTISDLANQKNVLVKIKGWKLGHLTEQIDRMVESEVEVVQQFTQLLVELSPEDVNTPANTPNRDLIRIEDLLKGNLQRCKVVKDQLTESKSQVGKVLEHHPRILDVINKHISKRPVKKREKL